MALKKIFDAFQNSTDAQRTFREIMFLQVRTHSPQQRRAGLGLAAASELRSHAHCVFCLLSPQELNAHHHENIIRLLNVLKADNDKDIYLVFEYMEINLHAVIKANILEEVHKRYILYQNLKAIKYMHSGGQRRHCTSERGGLRSHVCGTMPHTRKCSLVRPPFCQTDLLHRDMKPSNVLLNSDCHVKVNEKGEQNNIKADQSLR